MRAFFGRGLAVTMLSVVAACGKDEASNPAPATPATADEPEPPPGLALPDGEPLFSLDTTTPEFVVSVAGTDATIAAVLGASDGRRRIELRQGAGVTEIAPVGWYLLPAGATGDAGDVLTCWNALTGSASGGAMPHPSRGVALRCRAANGTTLGEMVTLPTGSAMGAWLTATTYEDGAYRVRYLRDEAGWLVMVTGHDDGLYEIAGDGRQFGEPALIARGSLVP